MDFFQGLCGHREMTMDFKGIFPRTLPEKTVDFFFKDEFFKGLLFYFLNNFSTDILRT